VGAGHALVTSPGEGAGGACIYVCIYIHVYTYIEHVYTYVHTGVALVTSPAAEEGGLDWRSPSPLSEGAAERGEGTEGEAEGGTE
jgi:hypothetical protein